MNIVEKIIDDLQSLWLESKSPNLLVLDTKTLDEIYMTSDVKMFETLEEKLDIPHIVISEKFKGYRFFVDA